MTGSMWFEADPCCCPKIMSCGAIGYGCYICASPAVQELLKWYNWDPVPRWIRDPQIDTPIFKSSDQERSRATGGVLGNEADRAPDAGQGDVNIDANDVSAPGGRV